MWVIQNTEEAQSNIFGIEETNIDVYAAALELIFKFGECETGMQGPIDKYKAACSFLARRKLMLNFRRVKRNRVKHFSYGGEIWDSDFIEWKMSPNDGLVRYEMDLNEDGDVTYTCTFLRKDEKGQEIKKNDQKFYDMVYYMGLFNEKQHVDYGHLPVVGAIKKVIQTPTLNILKTGENRLQSEMGTEQLSNLITSPPVGRNNRERLMMLCEFITMILDLLSWCQWQDIWFNGPLELQDFLYTRIDRNKRKSHRTFLYQFNDTFYSKLFTATTDSQRINGTKHQMRWNVLQALPLVEEFSELVKYNPGNYKGRLQTEISWLKDEMKDLKTVSDAQYLKKDAWTQVIKYQKEVDDNPKEIIVNDCNLL